MYLRVGQGRAGRAATAPRDHHHMGRAAKFWEPAGMYSRSVSRAINLDASVDRNWAVEAHSFRGAQFLGVLRQWYLAGMDFEHASSTLFFSSRIQAQL